MHLYDDRLLCYLGVERTLELPRLREKRGKCVDYKHVITSLVRKPGAFRYSILRNDLLPDATYKEIWHLMDKLCKGPQACKLMVGILKLANDSKQQCQLGLEILGNINTWQYSNSWDVAKEVCTKYYYGDCSTSYYRAAFFSEL